MNNKSYLLILSLYLLGVTLAAQDQKDWWVAENDDIYIAEERSQAANSQLTAFEGSADDEFPGGGSGDGSEGDDEQGEDDDGSADYVVPIRPIKRPGSQAGAPDVEEPPKNEETIQIPTDSGEEDTFEPPKEANPKSKNDQTPGTEVEIKTVSPGTDDLDDDILKNKQDGVKRSSIVGQPGILAGIIGGAVVGLLCAVLLVMFIVYRMRKKDEGSYALDEPKRSPQHAYTRAKNQEFFA
jgi:hypothetical protein